MPKKRTRIYRFEKGLGYLEVLPENLEKYVPELGTALDMAAKELTETFECPGKAHEYEHKGSCANNCTNYTVQEQLCWKEYFLQKAREEKCQEQ